MVDRPFVGLENYTTLFTDPAVHRSFFNVGIFLIINVPLTVVISLVLATLLNRVSRLKTFLRVSFYVPVVAASVAVVAVWLFLFSGDGLVNTLLGPIAPDPTWLISPTWAMPSIAFFVTWKGMGIFILLTWPPSRTRRGLYESAATDGPARCRASGSDRAGGATSTSWCCCWTVTGANLFTEPCLLTGGGGPNGASSSPVLIMYQQGIEQGKPGYPRPSGSPW